MEGTTSSYEKDKLKERSWLSCALWDLVGLFAILHESRLVESGCDLDAFRSFRPRQTLRWCGGHQGAT
jgi:hypothetical protein